MSTRVRRMLVEHLAQSVLTLDAAATALAVSRRTLTRPLAEERAYSAIFSMRCEVISRTPASGSHPEHRRHRVLTPVIRTRGAGTIGGPV